MRRGKRESRGLQQAEPGWEQGMHLLLRSCWSLAVTPLPEARHHCRPMMKSTDRWKKQLTEVFLKSLAVTPLPEARHHCRPMMKSTDRWKKQPPKPFSPMRRGRKFSILKEQSIPDLSGRSLASARKKQPPIRAKQVVEGVRLAPRSRMTTPPSIRPLFSDEKRKKVFNLERAEHPRSLWSQPRLRH
ncbi:hypothetical protein C4D60_Mb00t03360 [Musa balbisiana]|uniref:Uncharacterized protein n=1 Tax=Musa balbisiana TaxID=52838 RepID=A0A4S8I816_MUSBA|nr:hypothetical protein C4D60_Mb00t03360 [Musa balbisiana]